MLSKESFIWWVITLAAVNATIDLDQVNLHVQSDVLHLNQQEKTGLNMFEAYARMSCSTEGFYGNPANCSHFYRCVDLTGNATQYQKFVFSCPNEAVFDEDLSICNHPAVVRPCIGAIGGLVGAISDDDVLLASPPFPDITDEVRMPLPPTVAPSIANLRCKKPGVFRSPDDCRKFHICVDVFGDGTYFQLCEYPCPNNLIFSENAGHCVEHSEGEPCAEAIPTTPTPPTTTSSLPITTIHTNPPTPSSTRPPPTYPPTVTPPVPLPPIVPGPPCNREGVFRHPYDCTKFYQCVDVSGNKTLKRYNRYDFQCGPGTVFDESLSVCNHPHAVPECAGFVPVQPVYPVIPPSVTPQAITTRPPTFTGYPVHPTEPPRPQTPTTTPSTTATVPSTTTTFPSTTTYIPITVTVPQITTHPGTEYPVTPGPVILLPPVTTGQPCSTEGFFIYPDDCSKFYRCVDKSGSETIKHFIRYDFQCGNQTVFDTSLNICNHPSNVPGCGGSGSPGSWTQRPTVYPTHVPITPVQLPPCVAEGFFPHPHDCTRYYKCVAETSSDGTYKTFKQFDYKCPHGSIFDVSLHICNHPLVAVGCGGSVSPVHSSTTPHPVTTHPPQTISFIPGSVPFQPEIPAPQCHKSGFFRYKGDCRKFYRCVERINEGGAIYFERYDYQCVHGNVFDDAYLVCTHPNKVPGCGGTHPSPPRPTHRPPKPGPSPVHPGGPGPYCLREGYFHYPNDCTRFYQCVDVTGNGTVQRFQRHDFKCGPGTVFDESLGVCNHPHAVPGCGTGGFIVPSHTTHYPYPYPTKPAVTRPTVTYPTPRPTSRPTPHLTPRPTPHPTHRPTPHPTPKPTQRPYPTPGPVVPLPPVIGGMPCSAEGYFRYANDCSKFYRCVDISGNGTSKQYLRYDFQCGNGTVFDVSINVCNHPQHVPGCERYVPTSVPSQPRPTPVYPGYPSTTKWPVRPTGTPVLPVIPGPYCSREGVFRDPYDCTKFYQCVDVSGNNTLKRYNRYDFKCGPGTVFDESLSVCNHPHAVPGCGGSIATSPTAWPVVTPTYPSTTTPGFKPPKPIEHSTIGSTAHVTHPTQTVPTYPTPPTNPTQPVVTHPTHPVPTYPTYPVGSQSTQRPRPPIPSTHIPFVPSQGPPCVQEGFFRYPDNCAKFYYCLDVSGNRTTKQFVKYDYLCGPGTVFDQSLNVCNHPLFVPGCEHFVGQPPSPTQGTGTNPPSATTQSTVIVGVGAHFCKKEGFFRDPQDCSKFYRCAFTRVNGTTKRLEKYEFHCTFGFVFDEREVICTKPDNVPECVDYIPPATTPCPYPHITVTTESQPSASTASTTHLHTSPVPLSTYPTVINTISTTTTTTTAKPTTTVRATTVTTTAATTVTTTGAPKVTEPTRPIHITLPVLPIGPEGSQCTREGMWRNPKDCTKFYRCVAITDDGRVFKRFEFKCPNGTVFDNHNVVCNYPHASPPCPLGQGPSIHIPTHPSGGHVTVTPGSSTQDGKTDSPTTSSSITTTTGGESITHICTEAGSFKDPNDCSKYYLCTDLTGNGTHFHMCEVPCPEESFFDESSQRCSKHVGRYSCKFDLSTVLDLLRFSSSDINEQFDTSLSNDTENHEEISEEYFNQLKAQLSDFQNEPALFL